MYEQKESFNNERMVKMRKNKIIAVVSALCLAAGCAGTENVFSLNDSENASGVPVFAAEEKDETVIESEKETSGKCGDDAEWTYDTETKTLTISGTGDVTKTFYSEKWFSEVKNLIVEDGIEVLHGAFYGCKTLETVSLPDSIKNIDGAFEYCTALKSVTVPEGVKSIAFGTFMGCSSLEELHLGSDLRAIGWGAISECPLLKHIDIPETVTNIDENAFYNSGIESIKLPDNIKTIPHGAFVSCADLADVILPSELEHIEREAFAGTAIEKIDIPESTCMIDEYAFVSCSSLKKVTVRCDTCVISDAAFTECSPELMIKAHKGSTAEEYAERNGYAFEALEAERASVPVPVESPYPINPGPRYPGDVDVNGKIDVTDITVLSLALVDKQELSVSSFGNADVNGDGKVELDDLAYIRQFLSKKISSFDVMPEVSVPFPAGSPVPMD